MVGMNSLQSMLLFAVLAWLRIAAPPALAAEPANYAPTFADVRYGQYDRNVLDFFQAPTAEPAPVLVYFHGGGWTGGDKKSFNPAPVLRAGISVVTANYRFTTGTPDAAPYPAPMLDGARVVQFIRSKAAEWHIDPQRIALTGNSAGGVTSLWIAYRPDMAKPDSADPIERFSTRVACVLPQNCPTTLDPRVILSRIGGSPTIHPAILPLFHVKSVAELDAPEFRQQIEDGSPVNQVTPDDPPTFMQYPTALGGTPLPPEASPNISIHHAEFGRMLKEKLDAAGVENVLQTAGDGSDPAAILKFLQKHLRVGPADSQ